MTADAPIHVPDSGLARATAQGDIPEALRGRINRVLIPEAHIQARIGELAELICADFSAVQRVTALIVLDGALVFAADLGRQVHRSGGPEVDFDFIKTRTYGDEVKNEGERTREVRLMMTPRELWGRHVLLVEDVIDQGFTLTQVQQWVQAQEPASFRTCALLSKRLLNPTPEVRHIRDALQVHYVGFEVPDVWVAGYGTDVCGDFRELPFIVAIEERHYTSSPTHR